MIQTVRKKHEVMELWSLSPKLLSDEPVERLGLDPPGVGFFEDRPVGNDLEKSRSMNPAEKTFPPVYPFIDWLSKIIVRKEIQGYYPLSLYFISYICIIF